jgi:O-antigen ligase
MNQQTARPLLTRLAFLCLWIFVFSMPIEKAIEIPGLGTISKLAGLISVGAGVLAIATQARFRIPGGVQIALAAFVLWSAITVRWSMAPDWTVDRTVTYVQLLSLVLLIWEFCGEERYILSLLNAYVLGTLIPAGDTVHRFLFGQMTYYNRYATTGFDPNDLALTLAISVPMSYYLGLHSKGVIRWIYRIQLTAAMGTIFLTASRGGTLAMLIGLSLILWTLPTLPMRSRISIVTLIGVTVGAAVALVPASSWNRLGTAASEVSQGTLNSRTVLWKAGFNEFQNTPFGGVGAGAYPETSAKVIGRPWGFVPVAHNSFISVLVETGIIGMTIFAVMLGMLFQSAARMSGINRSFWLTLLCVWAIGVCSLTWEYRKPTWLLFGLAAAHAASIRKQTARRIETSINLKRYFNAAHARVIEHSPMEL